jgi:hypothetical protein
MEGDEKVPKGSQMRKNKRKQSYGKKASDRALKNSGLLGSDVNKYSADMRILGGRSENHGGAVNEKQISLKHFLGAGGWRFCSFEFLKSKWDAAWYNDSAMATLIQKCGLKATHFHRYETWALRDLLGRPRRLSWKFLRDCRLDASVRRQKLDEEEANDNVKGNRFGFEVGQNVIAIHPMMHCISDGVILTVSKASCRVQFDRSDLGVHMVPIENIMEKPSSPVNERYRWPGDTAVKFPGLPHFLDSNSLADIASLLDSKEHLIGKAKMVSIDSSSKQGAADLKDIRQKLGAVNSLLNKGLPLVQQDVMLTKENCGTDEEIINICGEESKKLFEECERKLEESNSGQTVKYWQMLDPSQDEIETDGINAKSLIKLSKEYRNSLATLIKRLIQLLLVLTSTGCVDPEMFSSILQVGLFYMPLNVLLILTIVHLYFLSPLDGSFVF